MGIAQHSIMTAIASLDTMFQLITVFWAFIFIGILLLLGRIVRQRWPLMQSPSG